MACFRVSCALSGNCDICCWKATAAAGPPWPAPTEPKLVSAPRMPRISSSLAGARLAPAPRSEPTIAERWESGPPWADEGLGPGASAPEEELLMAALEEAAGLTNSPAPTRPGAGASEYIEPDWDPTPPGTGPKPGSRTGTSARAEAGSRAGIAFHASRAGAGTGSSSAWPAFGALGSGNELEQLLRVVEPLLKFVLLVAEGSGRQLRGHAGFLQSRIGGDEANLVNANTFGSRESLFELLGKLGRFGFARRKRMDEAP